MQTTLFPAVKLVHSVEERSATKAPINILGLEEQLRVFQMEGESDEAMLDRAEKEVFEEVVALM